jgi:hypothetical protein
MTYDLAFKLFEARAPRSQPMQNDLGVKIGSVYRCKNNNLRIYVIGIIPDDEWPILAACLDDNCKLGQFQPSQLKEDTDAE